MGLKLNSYGSHGCILFRMASPETIALTMEPEAGIYRDPLIVLDFQSLYPSISIAYNYCFSTCLGRVSNIANCGIS